MSVIKRQEKGMELIGSKSTTLEKNRLKKAVIKESLLSSSPLIA
jgi:ribosomal 50S subunit-associated protein YjgA (DUF615 family)